VSNAFDVIKRDISKKIASCQSILAAVECELKKLKKTPSQVRVEARLPAWSLSGRRRDKKLNRR
jgi:hypothetical protein